MDETSAGELLYLLEQMLQAFRRMADAAEAQVKETKAMRQMVKTASLKTREDDDG